MGEIYLKKGRKVTNPLSALQTVRRQKGKKAKGQEVYHFLPSCHFALLPFYIKVNSMRRVFWINRCRLKVQSLGK